MKRQILEELLKREAAAKTDGDSLLFPSDAEVTLFVAVGIEPLLLEQVVSLRLLDDVLLAATRRAGTFAVAYEDIRALRVGATDRRTGY